MADGVIARRRIVSIVLSTLALTGGCADPPRGENLELPLSATRVVSGAESTTWPSWHGGSRHGVADAEHAPLHWSSVSGVGWRAEIPGRGNSSPVVWGDRVMLTATDANDELVLHCLDLATGDPLWTRSLGSVGGRTHAKNGHASATVAVDGLRAYVSVGGKGLFCVSLDGERLWHASLGSLDHQWGASSSPILHGDLVIQLCDSQSESHLTAFNRFTGKTAWSAERRSDGNWTTPIVVSARDDGARRDELVVNGTGSADGSGGVVIAYDPATGRELWRVRGTSSVPCPTLVAAKDVIISATGSNGPVMAIRPGGRGDVTDSRVVWRHEQGGPYVPTGVIVDKLYFSVSDGGVATCREVETGRQVWQQRLGGAFSASLTACRTRGGPTRVYAVSERGDVHVFAAQDRFEPLAHNRLGEGPCLATPAWADGKMLLRTECNLYCIVGVEVDAKARQAAVATAEDVRTEGSSRRAPSGPAEQSFGAIGVNTDTSSE